MNNNNNNTEQMLLSDGDKVLVDLVSRGLTDDEIAAQLQIPRLQVLHRIARLLAKFGGQERIEIVLYAYSDPRMYKRLSASTKDPKLPTMKQNAG